MPMTSCRRSPKRARPPWWRKSCRKAGPRTAAGHHGAEYLVALGQIANYWRRQFAMPVIGVTGSNGKTTVKEMIAASWLPPTAPETAWPRAAT
jgi:UDP-N-acetylmuramyl tripeptide synthase